MSLGSWDVVVNDKREMSVKWPCKTNVIEKKKNGITTEKKKKKMKMKIEMPTKKKKKCRRIQINSIFLHSLLKIHTDEQLYI